MTREHRNSVLELAPRHLRRTFMLTEAAQLSSVYNAQTIGGLAELRPQLAAHDVWDIADPIGKDAEPFEMVGSQIAKLLPPILALRD